MNSLAQVRWAAQALEKSWGIGLFGPPSQGRYEVQHMRKCLDSRNVGHCRHIFIYLLRVLPLCNMKYVTRASKRIVAMIATADKIVDSNIGPFESLIESIFVPTTTQYLTPRRAIANSVSVYKARTILVARGLTNTAKIVHTRSRSTSTKTPGNGITVAE